MHKILVVEDVEIARNVMYLVLKKFNCDVDMAKNGIEALQLFFDNKYDLIFMDLGLPDINGVTVTKLMRNYGKQGDPHTPVVAITAHSEDKYKQECRTAGMDGFLEKPINVEEIQAIINELILPETVNN